MSAITDLSYWVDTTSAFDGNSGIQRVTRYLAAGLDQLGYPVEYLCWSNTDVAPVRCPGERRRKLARWNGPPARGWWQNAMRSRRGAAAGNERDIGGWLIVPELTYHDILNQRAQADLAPLLIEHAHRMGKRAAFVFYDLIPMTTPGYEELRGAHALYLRHLAQSDLILAISHHSAAALARHFRDNLQLAAALQPSIRVVPLPPEFPGWPRETFTAREYPPVEIVSIGSIEPRKNQAMLLRAFNALSAEHPEIAARLCLIGHIFPELREEIAGLAAVNPHVEIVGYLPDSQMIERLRRSHFTVFPSVEEGFGLPIAESLWFGKPCLCANFGAMAEIADGGGCLAIDMRSETEIRRALERLISDEGFLRRLTEEAASRHLATWRDYAAEVAAVLGAENAGIAGRERPTY